MTIFLNYFLLFLIYSILGWIMESTYVFIKNKKFVNRGFLLGPYCPIYGFGAIIIILYLNQYKDNLLTVFIMSMVLCSILEYVTSFLMEKLFNTRWWDYSNKKFNLNGRICGYNSLLFGIASIVVLYLINPLVTDIIKYLNTTALCIISSIGLIIFLTDTIISCNIINKLKSTVKSIDVKSKDSTTEITKMVRENLKASHKTFQTRIIKAFPHINFENIVNRKRKNIIKRLFNKK